MNSKRVVVDTSSFSFSSSTSCSSAMAGGLRVGECSSCRAAAAAAVVVVDDDAGRGLLPPPRRQSPPDVGSVLYTAFVVDSGGKPNGLSSGGGELLHGVDKVGFNGLKDQREAGSTGVLKRASPTHCPTRTGRQLPEGLMLLDIRNSGKRLELANGFHAAAPPPGQSPVEDHPRPSSHIPVPRHRKPSGHADKEVMAATVLTSLSTSPLVLHPTSTPTAAVPEPAWKEALSASYSSSTSGNWSWDASDQSVPSTPSPPLSNDASKSFLLCSHGDDVNEDGPESTHFLFEDPIPRKRKNSMKVMFKCLWKNCEKVLSTSSGIQRHVRTIHLGQISDSDYSDGEEDFYYTEIEVNMDSLSEGLSSLTPTSPTTAGPPPVFPPPPPPPPPALALAHAHAHIPRSEHISVKGFHGDAPTLLSQSAPSTLCHIRTDHAYQGPLSHVSSGERRQGVVPGGANTAANKTHALTSPAPKPAPGSRKPRGEAKKCRKVYGMEKRDMWCTACRWKKACQRFTD